MLVVKIYNRTFTTLKETLKGSLLLSDISFTSTINWWQGEATFEIAKEIINTDYSLWDIVKVIKYDDNNKDWVNLYMGYVNKIKRKQTTNVQTISLVCLGMASILTENEYSKAYWWNNAWDLVENIIDVVNTEYWTVINKWTIETWPTMWNWTATWTYFDIITQIAEWAWMYWFIDGNWTFTFKSKDTTPTHFFTNQKDVEEIDIWEDMEWVINKCDVKWEYEYCETSWWETFCWTKYCFWTYTDATSASLYWIKKESIDINANSEEICNNYAESYVNQRKDPKKETTLVINRKYNLESIKPWDTVKVRNFEYPFSNIQIKKIWYTQDKAILYLDRYISFWEQIKKVF
jgi:hypothetical protein